MPDSRERSVDSAPESKRRATCLGLALLVASALLWSLNGPLIKLMHAPGVAGILPEADASTDRAARLAVTIACFRSLIGGLVLLPIAFGRRQTIRRASPKWVAAAVICFTTLTVCFVLATTLTAAANAIILQYTAPIWVIALSPWLLRERPTRRQIACMAVALLGVAILFAGNALGQRPQWTGMLLALGSGVAYGVLIVVLRGLRDVDAVVVTTINTLGSGLLLLFAVPLVGTLDLSAAQWLVLGVMAVVQFTLPYVLFAIAVRYVDATQAAIITLLEMVLNPVWTWLVVGEIPPPATLLGGPLVLAAVAAAAATRSTPRG